MPNLQAAAQRKSNPFLVAPAPNDEQLYYMMQAAARAPDHANLSPYRFIVVPTEQLEQLGQLFLQASLHNQPSLTQAEKNKIIARPLRAPMIIISIARIQAEHEKIPASEQLITAGLAVHQLTIAAKELGFDSMWRTGPIAYNTQLAQLLKLTATEQITGFIYIGSAKKDKPQPAAKDIKLLYSNLDELV